MRKGKKNLHELKAPASKDFQIIAVFLRGVLFRSNLLFNFSVGLMGKNRDIKINADDLTYNILELGKKSVVYWRFPRNDTTQTLSDSYRSFQ